MDVAIKFVLFRFHFGGAAVCVCECVSCCQFYFVFRSGLDFGNVSKTENALKCQLKQNGSEAIPRGGSGSVVVPLAFFLRGGRQSNVRGASVAHRKLSRALFERAQQGVGLHQHT